MQTKATEDRAQGIKCLHARDAVSDAQVTATPKREPGVSVTNLLTEKPGWIELMRILPVLGVPVGVVDGEQEFGSLFECRETKVGGSVDHSSHEWGRGKEPERFIQNRFEDGGRFNGRHFLLDTFTP